MCWCFILDITLNIKILTKFYYSTIFCVRTVFLKTIIIINLNKYIGKKKQIYPPLPIGKHVFTARAGISADSTCNDATLSKKILYKFLGTNTFQHNLVYAWESSPQFLMKLVSKGGRNGLATANPEGFFCNVTWRAKLRNYSNKPWKTLTFLWKILIALDITIRLYFQVDVRLVVLENIFLPLMSSGESLHSNVEMASAREERPKLMWRPNPERSTNIHEFQSLVNHAFSLNLSEYFNYFLVVFKKWVMV